MYALLCILEVKHCIVQKQLSYWIFKKKKAAVRVKGQMTDGPITKNIYVMFYLCTKFHAFLTK